MRRALALLALCACTPPAPPAAPAAPAPPTRSLTLGEPGSGLMRIEPGRPLRPVDDPRDIPSRWQGMVVIDFADHRAGRGYYIAELFDAEPGQVATARLVSARRLTRLAEDLIAASEVAELVAFNASLRAEAPAPQAPVAVNTPGRDKGQRDKRGRGAPSAAAAAPSLIIESVGGRPPDASGAASASGAPQAARGKASKPGDHAALVEGAMRATNAARGEAQNCGLHGVKPPVGALKRNAALERAAQGYAEEMARHHHFGHTGPDGSTPDSRAAAAGYRTGAGENLARGPRSAQAAIDGLLESDGHCTNMMDDAYRALAIGVADDDKGRRYWVQLFGVVP